MTTNADKSPESPLSTTLTTPVFLLGGTFDPVHYGHIAAVNYLASRFPQAEHRLLPNRQPVHKPIPTDSAHRLAMLEACRPLLAANVSLDTTDLTLQNANTTYNTLQALRRSLGTKRPLVWVMGDDVFCTIDTWGDWQALLTLAHFFILPRAHTSYPAGLESSMQRYLCSNQDFLTAPFGSIILDQDFAPPAISATQIRSRAPEGLSLQDLTPAPVANYISRTNLYRC